MTSIAAGEPSQSVTERLGQLEESAATIDRRIGEIDGELAVIEESAIDLRHVAATLAEFSELWDVLYPQERTRIVHLLVEQVAYNGDQGGVQIVFRSNGDESRATEPHDALV